VESFFRPWWRFFVVAPFENILLYSLCKQTEEDQAGARMWTDVHRRAVSMCVFISLKKYFPGHFQKLFLTITESKEGYISLFTLLKIGYSQGSSPLNVGEPHSNPHIYIKWNKIHKEVKNIISETRGNCVFRVNPQKKWNCLQPELRRPENSVFALRTHADTFFYWVFLCVNPPPQCDVRRTCRGITDTSRPHRLTFTVRDLADNSWHTCWSRATREALESSPVGGATHADGVCAPCFSAESPFACCAAATCRGHGARHKWMFLRSKH